MKGLERPAFPAADNVIGMGLTKRELFAAMAMQSMLSIQWVFENHSEETIARMSAQQADALLAELAKDVAS